MITFYRIYCKDDDVKECYVGSTKNFRKRRVEHKTKCNNPNSTGYNLKVYKFIRENGGYENFQFEILDEVECDKTERFRIEREYFEMCNASLNSDVPGRTAKEYRETHRDELKEKHKQYRETHKDELKEYRKEYYKEYREKHKEYYKEYREKHKEQIREIRKQKTTCECGSVVRRDDISRHRKSQKHQNLIQSN